MRFYLDKEFDKERINTLGKNELTTLIEGAGGIVRIFKGNSELFKVKDNIRICDFLVLKKNSKKKTSTPPHVKTIILQVFCFRIKFINLLIVDF